MNDHVERECELRDAQGQVAALATSAVALVHSARRAAQYGDSKSPYLHVLKNRATELETAYADLPAASKAILAAAEREPGLREALDRASEWIAAVEVGIMPGAGDTQTEVLNIVNAALAQGGHGS